MLLSTNHSQSTMKSL